MHTGSTTRRGGFSLLEAMMSCAILAMSVVALSAAISAGQQASFESQKAVLAAMTADDLLSEVTAVDYSSLPDLNGRTEPVGEMETLAGAGYPILYWALGRRIAVEDTKIVNQGAGVIVAGRMVSVTVFDESRDVATVELFVPEEAE